MLHGSDAGRDSVKNLFWEGAGPLAFDMDSQSLCRPALPKMSTSQRLTISHAHQEVAWDELLNHEHTPHGFQYNGLLINGTQDYDCPCQPGQCHGPEKLFSFTAHEDGLVDVSAGPYRQAEDLGGPLKPLDKSPCLLHLYASW